MGNTEKLEKQWLPFIQRYEKGEWRAPIFRDMIVADANRLAQNNDNITLLDIGCGSGFDGDSTLQKTLAQVVWRYIGVEPDKEIELGNWFSQAYRCRFEDAEIEPDTVNIAFAVMVLEHVNNPEVFWHKLYDILKKGGVFWGFTIDARHWFAYASILAEKIRIKDWYLNKLYGVRGSGRYDNYPVYYRCNKPRQIQVFTRRYASCCLFNFKRVGQMECYFPNNAKWISRLIDRVAISLGCPGGIMAIRVEK